MTNSHTDMSAWGDDGKWVYDGVGDDWAINGGHHTDYGNYHTLINRVDIHSPDDIVPRAARDGDDPNYAKWLNALDTCPDFVNYNTPSDAPGTWNTYVGATDWATKTDWTDCSWDYFHDFYRGPVKMMDNACWYVSLRVYDPNITVLSPCFTYYNIMLDFFRWADATDGAYVSNYLRANGGIDIHAWKLRSNVL